MDLLGGLLGGDAEVEPPKDDLERRKLEHERRKLERRIRDLEKALDRSCGAACAQSPVRKDRLAASRELKDRRERLEVVEARLDADPAS